MIEMEGARARRLLKSGESTDLMELLDAANEILASITEEDTVPCACDKTHIRGLCLYRQLLGGAVAMMFGTASQTLVEGDHQEGMELAGVAEEYLYGILNAVYALGRREAEAIPEAFGGEPPRRTLREIAGELEGRGAVEMVSLRDLMETEEDDEALARRVADQIAASLLPRIREFRAEQAGGEK